MKNNHRLYYFLALITIIIWSSTFISTKILLTVLSPTEILVYRFILAYLLMFLVYPHIHPIENLKNELKLVLAGISGGSLYFLSENYALGFSLASNVSLLVSTAPILTAFVAHIFLKNEKVKKTVVFGGAVAFVGVALIIFNGKFILKLNPLGDMLAILSALSWAFYSVIIKTLKTRYSSYYITRKIFFYTLLTIIPVLFFSPVSFNPRPLLDWKIALNLVFLAVFASCAAYVVWNKVVWAFGAVKSSNFIYLIPLFTMLESTLFLHEALTVYSITGALLIFTGVYITSRIRL